MFKKRDILSANDQYAKFLELMDGSGLFETLHATGSRSSACGGTNISLFSSYHYTVYVPSNEAIQALHDNGSLPTWSDVDEAGERGDLAKKTADSLKIMNFVKYHIQDNAVFVGASPVEADYETAVIDPKTERFYKLHVSSTGNAVNVTDNLGNTRHVVTSDERVFNKMAREFQYNERDAQKASQIETSSSAVVHLIDGALLIEN